MIWERFSKEDRQKADLKFASASASQVTENMTFDEVYATGR